MLLGEVKLLSFSYMKYLSKVSECCHSQLSIAIAINSRLSIAIALKNSSNFEIIFYSVQITLKDVNIYMVLQQLSHFIDHVYEQATCTFSFIMYCG